MATDQSKSSTPADWAGWPTISCARRRSCRVGLAAKRLSYRPDQPAFGSGRRRESIFGAPRFNTLSERLAIGQLQRLQGRRLRWPGGDDLLAVRAGPRQPSAGLPATSAARTLLVPAARQRKSCRLSRDHPSTSPVKLATRRRHRETAPPKAGARLGRGRRNPAAAARRG